ncbi:MAG: general secretion pathway protein GspB [Candidatus Omnitrophica bacterium]|jgi:hypothetical protein|nr:general secretion pathway protein GspB [Candidatus Omnitrophota bacterium]
MVSKLKLFIFLLLFFSVAGTIYPENEEIKLPDVCVSGILYDTDSSLAVVNGESLRQGEQINGMTIVKISDSTVSFEYKGKTFEKTIGEGCLTPQLIYKKTAEITKFINRPKSQQASRKKSGNNRRVSSLGYESIFVLTLLAVSIVLYIYNSLCLSKIANKTNTPFGWFAWLPILNIFLMLMIARKSFWWLILLLIPLVNFICIIIIWMEIAKMRNKPAWLGLLMMLPLPFANFIIIGYLAFSR